MEGVNYIFSQRGGLYFVVTSIFNISPCVTVELINRLIKLFTDYCGILNEQALRENFILLYELLDEVIDFGYPQDTSAELLKNFIFNEPVTKNGQGGSKDSIINAKDKNELFVDIVERLNIVFNSEGDVIMSSIDGQFKMKSFLQGNPLVTCCLDPNIILGRANVTSEDFYTKTIIDDANLHECIDIGQFEESHNLVFYPPDGEFVAMNYRMTTLYKPPFKIYPMVEQEIDTKIEVIVKIVAEFEKVHSAANVGVVFHGPSSAVSCSLSVPDKVQDQLYEYKDKDKKVIWLIRKFDGESEHVLRAVFSLDSPASPHVKKEIGPIIITFEIPSYIVSGMKIEKLDIEEKDPKNKPNKWLRKLTTNSSYVCRL